MRLKLLIFSILTILSVGANSAERLAVSADQPAPVEGKIAMEGEMFVLGGLSSSGSGVWGLNFEYGFIIPKGNFDAILSFSAEHVFLPEKLVKSDGGDGKTNAAHVGGKAGVTYPLSTRFGLSPLAVIGYQKSSIQRKAWFGTRDGSLNSSDIYFVELGTFAYHKQYVSRLAFRYSTAVYSNFGFFYSIGVSY